MDRIKDIIVINQDSCLGFEESLKEAVKKLEDKELEVIINNPRMIINGNVFNYVAVVEGRWHPY